MCLSTPVPQFPELAVAGFTLPAKQATPTAMTKYTKPHLSFDEQLALIEGRGLSTVDREFAKAGLERLGYYRLSAYWYPFRIRYESHREGTDTPENNVNHGYTLDDIIRICDFDGLLRNLLLAETGKHDPFAYLSKSYWGAKADAPSQVSEESTQYEAFRQRHIELVERSKEPFARHFRNSYDGTLPIWAAIEL